MTATDVASANRTPRADPGREILAAGQRLIGTKGIGFTTQDLVKEAGVALQTFYRYFGGKDELLLALIADLIRQHCLTLRHQVEGVADPIERFEHYVRSTLAPLDTEQSIVSAQFITAEHWRLHQHFPAEIWAATQPFTDLIRGELDAAQELGLLEPGNAQERNAWLVTKTVLAAHHHYSYQPDDPAMVTVADDVWAFCLAAVGGSLRP